MTTGERIESWALTVTLATCALVLGLAGWAVVLRGHWLGLPLIVAAACSAVVARGQWSWR